ncbi:hypothetical protein E4T47_08201 [Aureobasidium subglaciale]|nr:hypothetical protein E4T47_08201 [Aureobasidium subglaciale]
MQSDLCFIHQDITHRRFTTVASRDTLGEAKRLSGFGENSFLHKTKSRAEFPLSTQSPAKNCPQNVQWLAGKREVRIHSHKVQGGQKLTSVWRSPR